MAFELCLIMLLLSELLNDKLQSPIIYNGNGSLFEVNLKPLGGKLTYVMLGSNMNTTRYAQHTIMDYA